MLESYSRCWTEIDYAAIAHNVEEIQKLVGDTKIMGIVKANAYGHGDVECAKALQKVGVDFFGVSSVDEALHLRQNGIHDSILILGYTPPEHFHYRQIPHLKTPRQNRQEHLFHSCPAPAGVRCYLSV